MDYKYLPYYNECAYAHTILCPPFRTTMQPPSPFVRGSTICTQHFEQQHPPCPFAFVTVKCTRSSTQPTAHSCSMFSRFRNENSCGVFLRRERGRSCSPCPENVAGVAVRVLTIEVKQVAGFWNPLSMNRGTEKVSSISDRCGLAYRSSHEKEKANL